MILTPTRMYAGEATPATVKLYPLDVQGFDPRSSGATTVRMYLDQIQAAAFVKPAEVVVMRTWDRLPGFYPRNDHVYPGDKYGPTGVENTGTLTFGGGAGGMSKARVVNDA